MPPTVGTLIDKVSKEGGGGTSQVSIQKVKSSNNKNHHLMWGLRQSSRRLLNYEENKIRKHEGLETANLG